MAQNEKNNKKTRKKTKNGSLPTKKLKKQETVLLFFGFTSTLWRFNFQTFLKLSALVSLHSDLISPFRKEASTSTSTNQPGPKNSANLDATKSQMFREQTKKKSGPTGLPLMNPKKNLSEKKKSAWKFAPPHLSPHREGNPHGALSDGAGAMFFVSTKKNVEGCGELIGDFLRCGWSVDIVMFGSYWVEARSKIWKGGYLRLWLVDFAFQICKTPYSNIGTMIISTTFVGLVAWFYHLLTFKQKQLGRPEDRQTDSTETDIKMQKNGTYWIKIARLEMCGRCLKFALSTLLQYTKCSQKESCWSFFVHPSFLNPLFGYI